MTCCTPAAWRRCVWCTPARLRAIPYTHFTLAQYNANPGNIHESYSNTVNGCAPTTFPTNAGFVPYTPQTMYIERGFGYYGSQDHNDANVAVPMTTGVMPRAAASCR